MIKTAPHQEIKISVCTSQGCTEEIPAWTTEVPGLLVALNGKCGLGGCYAVLPQALGDTLAICFPSRQRAAQFAIEIRDFAPWESPDGRRVWDAFTRFTPNHPIWDIAAAHGGIGHDAAQSA